MIDDYEEYVFINILLLDGTNDPEVDNQIYFVIIQ